MWATLCIVPQNMDLLPFLLFYIVRVISFKTTVITLSFLFTMSGSHLTIITLVH